LAGTVGNRQVFGAYRKNVGGAFLFVRQGVPFPFKSNQTLKACCELV
jgi:hypothetical protein